MFSASQLVSRVGLLLLSTAALAQSDSNRVEIAKLAYTQAWLRLFQYEKHGHNYYSEITSSYYFLSKEGRSNPKKEFEASLEAFENPNKLVGTQGLPAACSYPARKRVMENLLQRSLPNVTCTELDTWLERLGTEHLSILFAGTYSQNPASLFGHTALKFSGYKNSEYRKGKPLLSYAMGFVAQPPNDENKVTYMLKGLTGGYSGFYQIEPFYVTVGLYNNAESRDLWEHKLFLSEDEVRFLALHLWELSLNATVDYYFAKRNCSYRLLKFIEVVRPNINLVDRMGITVLPYDTVRVLQENGLLDPEFEFYSSIRRNHMNKLNKLNEQQLEIYKNARNSQEVVLNTKQAEVLDALLDEWNWRNYRAKTNLNEQEKQIMESTIEQRAKLAQISIDEKTQSMPPPHFGHKSKWLNYGLTSDHNNDTGVKIGFRYGAHGLLQDSYGYDKSMAIEYLGFDWDYITYKNTARNWSVLVVDARSYDHFSWLFPTVSWKFSLGLNKSCDLCENTAPTLRLSGGFGLSQHLIGDTHIASIMLNVETNTWADKNIKFSPVPSLDFLSKHDFGKLRLIPELKLKWWNNKWQQSVEFKSSFSLGRDFSIGAATEYSKITHLESKSYYGIFLENYF